LPWMLVSRRQLVSAQDYGLRHPLHRSHLGLLFGSCLFPSSLVLLLLASPTLALHANFSLPQNIDLCSDETCSLSISCQEEMSNLLAFVCLPEGFRYSGRSSLLCKGRRSSILPRTEGGSLRYDISSGARDAKQVVINEFEQNPDGPDGMNEWVELYNPASHAADLSGWRLIDSYYRKTVVLPERSIIPAGGYGVVTWSNGSLVNSYPMSLTLMDLAGSVIDTTLSASDNKDNELCWARVPDGRDLDQDADWKFQRSTKGAFNGGSCSDFYPGQSLILEIDFSATCNASSGKTFSAQVSHSGGERSFLSSAVEVRRANLSLTMAPDRYEAAKGDEIAWTITIKNDGHGRARYVQVNDILGSSLGLLSIDSPSSGLQWSYESLGAGEQEVVTLRARALSSSGYSNAINVSWGCGPCQQLSSISKVDQRTAIGKQPDFPRSLSIGERAGFQILAEFPHGLAREVWINDSLPAGLAYEPDSLSLQGARLLKEIISHADNGSQESQICWFLGDVDSPFLEINYQALVCNLPINQNGLDLPGGRAALSWLNVSHREDDEDEAGPITIVEPDLILEKTTSRPFGKSGDEISFFLAVFHSSSSSAPAFDLDLSEILPAGLRYLPGSAEVLSGPQASFDESRLFWRFPALDLSYSGSNRVLLRYNATLDEVEPGRALANNASLCWTSLPGICPEERDGSGGVNDYRRTATSAVRSMKLLISKMAHPDPVLVGDLLTYTLSYENVGAVEAHNVSIRDELDPVLQFISASPVPANPENDTWTIPRLPADGSHRIEITARVSDTLINGTTLQNRFSMQSDELGPISGTILTQVLNKTRLAVNKSSLQKAVRRGEEIDYVIRVCNLGGETATNITIEDVFSSAVELVSASPTPQADGLWRFEALEPGECLKIALTVRVPKHDLSFSEAGTAKGAGWAAAHKEFNTGLHSYTITNHIYVRCQEQAMRSAAADVRVLGEEGTELFISEHGSGSLDKGDEARFLSVNKSLQWHEEITALFQPVELRLPRGRSLNLASLWTVERRAKNGITGGSVLEAYRAKELRSDSRIALDENESKVDISSEFFGQASLEFRKRSRPLSVKGDILASHEGYSGRFSLQEIMSEYGKSATSDKTARGIGYVSVQKRMGSQGSYELGSGSYSSHEEIRTYTSYLSKELELVHSALGFPSTSNSLPSPSSFLGNYSGKWRAGTWSGGDGQAGIALDQVVRPIQGPCPGPRGPSPMAYIGQALSDIDYLREKTVAKGLNEMETNLSFYGRADLRALLSEDEEDLNGNHIDASEEYLGRYDIRRRVLLAGTAKYDRPHISVLVEGKLREGALHGSLVTMAIYNITVKNDGNRALGPLVITDLFPAGAQFINASDRPTELSTNRVNWTWTHLAVGGSSTLELRLAVDFDGSLVNRVLARGAYGQSWAEASGYVALEKSWLPGYPTAIVLHKTAEIDPADPRLVHYRLTIKNEENRTAAAAIIDFLPEDMQIMESYPAPASLGQGQAVWILQEVPPGETTIEYCARAARDGRHLNRATLEAAFFDGSEGGSSQDSVEVAIEGEPWDETYGEERECNCI
jgi:uncharacterized repeat protein (TIGR01451 family)